MYYCSFNFDTITHLLWRQLIPVKCWGSIRKNTVCRITEDSSLIALYFVINAHILLVNVFLYYWNQNGTYFVCSIVEHAVSFEHTCTMHCVKEHLVDKGSVEIVVKRIFILLWFLFQGSDLQSWNSWDDSPVSVITERSQSAIQQQIDFYRQQSTRHGSESDEPQPDFFEVRHWKFVMRCHCKYGRFPNT